MPPCNVQLHVQTSKGLTTGHRKARHEVKVIAGTRRLEKASHSQAHQHRRRDTNTHCSQALVICSFQNPESSRLRGIDGADPTFPSIRQPSSASKSGSVVCSAAAGFDLGRGSEEAAVPLLGGDDGSNGGDSRGGNGSGKFVDEADDQGGDDDTLLSMQQAEQLAGAKGIQLPADFIEAATAGGLRKSALEAYIALQGGLVAGLLSRTLPAVRDRLISDPRYLYKVFIEVAIDACCATIAEVKKRGDDFWSEFEFYMSDLVVGCALDVVLVSLMAPVAVIGSRPKSVQASGLQKWLAGVPSAVLEANIPGVRVYSLPQRAACILVKFGEYSLAGMFCGYVGQALANSLMLVKRQCMGASEQDVKPPPLVKTALTWGLFMGVSSNLRYQVVFGLERLVDVTVAKKFPPAAYVGSFVLRFINNVIGGEQFIDLARYTGVQ